MMVGWGGGRLSTSSVMNPVYALYIKNFLNFKILRKHGWCQSYFDGKKRFRFPSRDDSQPGKECLAPVVKAALLAGEIMVQVVV